MTIPRRRRLHSVQSQQTEAESFQALIAQNAPQIPWDEFLRRFQWRQSQHVALIGPNGSGKTNLLIHLLKMRDYVVLLATKPRDRTLEELVVEGGFEVFHEWVELDADKHPKRIIWPDARSLEADTRQAFVFNDSMHAIYDEGNWCLGIDEGFYVATELGLAKQMRKFWTQARSLDVSFVVGTQRPAWVPKEMYSESTHVFLWSMVEKDAVDRVSNLGRANVDLVKALIPQLPEHQFLYVNTRTGALYRSYAPYRLAADDEESGGDTG